MSIALGLVGVGSVSASAASAYKSVPIIVQEQSNWCWVATAKSRVKHHKGTNPTQCALYKQGTGATSCPNNTGDLAKMRTIFSKNGFSSPGTQKTGTLIFTDLTSDINANRIPVIRWGWNSTGNSTGHIVVPRGYNTSGESVSYIDPLKSSYQSGSHVWMENGGGLSWTHTLYAIRP